MARTSVSFGDVTTLFVVEARTIPEITLNNIKYLMDGIIEFDNKSGSHVARVCSMKWAKYSSEWINY